MAITPKKVIAAAKYFRARVCARYMATSLASLLYLVEIWRKAIGIHRGHPLQIGDDSLGLCLGDAEVRHRAGPGAVLLGVHQKFDHRPLARVGAGHRLPAFPIGIEPSFGQVRGVIGAVAEKGVAIDAGAALDHHLAPVDQHGGGWLIQRLAEQRLRYADHRHIEAAIAVEFVVDVPVDDGVGRHVRAARTDRREAVDRQHDQHDRHHGDRADRAGSPECWIVDNHIVSSQTVLFEQAFYWDEKYRSATTGRSSEPLGDFSQY